MTKNNDGRKHWRFGRIYEKEQAKLWNFLRKTWQNFGITVLAKTVAATLKIKTTTTTTTTKFNFLHCLGQIDVYSANKRAEIWVQ